MRLPFPSLVLLACGALAACTSASPLADTTPLDGGADAKPVVCCDLPATPPSCSDERYGGEKTSDHVSCIRGFDGVIPDPAAPGWVLAKDNAGCSIWVPPANAKTVQCGIAPPPPHPDGGTLPDSGPVPDSGTTPDGGTTPDSGPEPDSGLAPDAASD